MVPLVVLDPDHFVVGVVAAVADSVFVGHIFVGNVFVYLDHVVVDLGHVVVVVVDPRHVVVGAVADIDPRHAPVVDVLDTVHADLILLSVARDLSDILADYDPVVVVHRPVAVVLVPENCSLTLGNRD